MTKPLGPYSSAYIKGKAAKIIPGKFYLFVMSWGHSFVGIASEVKDQGEYASSLWVTSSFNGTTPVGLYRWFKQPSNDYRTTLDAIRLYSNNFADAEKEAEEVRNYIKTWKEMSK